MHFIQVKTDPATGQDVPVGMTEKLEMLTLDLNDLVITPGLWQSPADLDRFIRNSQIIGNNIRMVKREIMEKLARWESRRDRIQRAVGGSDKISDSDGKAYSDTGTKRRALQLLATSAWGPVGSKGNIAGVGLKSDLLPVEVDTALQLANSLAPGIDPPDIQRVEYSYDDLFNIMTTHLHMVQDMERQLESRHFDLNNVMKMAEMESFDKRRADKKD